jgi:phytoene dehydrogenase-like protein
MSRKRVLVIGTGIGGLTAVALLARDDFEVTVLEAHIYPGGCAGTFYYQGYHFDSGATFAGGFQPGGSHDIVGRLHDITWLVERLNPAWVVHLPDRTITRWGDQAARRAERDRSLPELRRFWPVQERLAQVGWDFAARLPDWSPTSPSDLWRLAKAMPLAMVPVAPFALATVGQWLDALDMPAGSARTYLDAQLLISVQMTAERANALCGVVALDLPRVRVYAGERTA